MRRAYLYMITIVLLSLMAWFSYRVYLEVHPAEYENGTFVELPEDNQEERSELAA